MQRVLSDFVGQRAFLSSVSSPRRVIFYRRMNMGEMLIDYFCWGAYLRTFTRKKMCVAGAPSVMLATENSLACWVPVQVLSYTHVHHLQIESRTALLIAVPHTTHVLSLTGSISLDTLHIASILSNHNYVLPTTHHPCIKDCKIRATCGKAREGKMDGRNRSFVPHAGLSSYSLSVASKLLFFTAVGLLG